MGSLELGGIEVVDFVGGGCGSREGSSWFGWCLHNRLYR